MRKPRILLSAVSKKENYEKAVRACGAIPIIEYKSEEMATYDGLILCGGNDNTSIWILLNSIGQTMERMRFIW